MPDRRKPRHLTGCRPGRYQLFGLLLTVSLLGACASTPVPGEVLEHSPSELLELMPPPEVAQQQAVPRPGQVLATNSDMKNFVATHVNPHARPGERLTQLLDAMLDSGLLALDYQTQQSQTAEETFLSRSGNCLSFTNLFVALAREAKLPVHFQTVDVPPNWTVQDNWVVLDQHINTIIQRIRIQGSYRRDYVVDFNIADFLGNYSRQQITDRQALAHFFSNRGAELLRDKNYSLAMAHLQRAAALEPRLSGIWINLGALLSTRGHLPEARSAYQHALQLEPDNPAALSNLALLYQANNELEQAERLHRRLQTLRQQNPYYFYQQSRTAFRQGHVEQAMRLVTRAIKLKANEHQFYFLRARLALAQGNADNARKNLALAHRYAADARLTQRYAHKLDQLQSSGS